MDKRESLNVVEICENQKSCSLLQPTTKKVMQFFFYWIVCGFVGRNVNQIYHCTSYRSLFEPLFPKRGFLIKKDRIFNTAFFQYAH